MRKLSVILLAMFFSFQTLKAQYIEKIEFPSLDAVLNSRYDTTYIVHFWATWCKPCKEEFADFIKLYRKYRDDEVRVIFVTFDMPHEADSKLIPYLKKHRYRSSIWVVDAGKVHEWMPKVSQKWNGTVPATMIARSGRKHFYEHPLDYKALKSEVELFRPVE